MTTGQMQRPQDTTSGLTIRQADSAATSFKVGDVISLSHLAAKDDSKHARNTDLYTVQSILVNTAEDADSTFTSLTLDRALNIPEAITDNDDAELRIVARVQDPLSRCSQLDREVNVYSFALKPEEHQPGHATSQELTPPSVQRRFRNVMPLTSFC